MHCNLWLIGCICPVMFGLYYLVGNAFLSRYMSDNYRAYFAPIVGYAIYAYLFFVLFHITTHIGAVWGLNIVLAGVGGWYAFKHKSKIPIGYGIAVLCGIAIASYAAYAMWLHTSANDLVLFAPAYDHVKIAITSSIATTGLPVMNPFGAFPQQLAYYFLYYVPCAAQSISFSASPYEVQIVASILCAIISWLTILGTLYVIRGKAFGWKTIVIGMLFVLTGPLYINWPNVLLSAHGIDSILVTLLWTPQTLLAVSELLVVLVLVYQHHMKYVFPIAFLLAVIAGLSVYIALVAAAGLGIFFCIDIYTSSKRKETLSLWVRVVLLGAILAGLFIVNQAGVKSPRFPIALQIYPWTQWSNPVWQIVGFWTLYLLLQLPLLFVLNVWKLSWKNCKQYAIFYVLIFTSLFITCFFRSVISNNDLGWRAVLVAVVLLTIFAVHWFSYIRSQVLKCSVLLVAVVLASWTFIGIDKNIATFPTTYPSSKLRFLSNESLAAIERYIGPEEYFLNNIRNEANIWWWDANLDFMIFSKRKSCYSSISAVSAYCDWRLRPFNTLNIIFKGEASAQDVANARAIHCNKFVFYQTDPNFNKEEALQAIGLHKIYANNQIKIFE